LAISGPGIHVEPPFTGRANLFADRSGVLLLDFGDSAVIYETSAWMHDPFNYRIAASDLRETIWVAFKRAGVVIALPQMDVHVAEQPGSGISATLGLRAQPGR